MVFQFHRVLFQTLKSSGFGLKFSVRGVGTLFGKQVIKKSPVASGGEHSLLSKTLKNFYVLSVAAVGCSSSKMHSEITVVDFPNLRIITIPAAQDNFMYLIVEKSSLQAFVVDPLEPESVLQEVRKQNVTLQGILTTHHHWDHAGGNTEMVALYAKESTEKLEVYGGDERVLSLSKKVGQGDKITLGSLNIECLFTPCHTKGHICYYLKTSDSKEQKPAVFTGDTLFISGCGKFFEGTADQMYSALISKLSQLPDETLVFCGHEYTTGNLAFAISIEPNNEAMIKKLEWAKENRSKKIPTVPSSIGEEKQINPFMRVDLPEIQGKVNASDGISCMDILRTRKNEFK